MAETPDNLRTKAEAGADDKRAAGSKPTTGGRASTGGREYVRDNDGQFAKTPGSGAKKPAAPTTGRRATDLGKRSQQPKGRAAKPRKGPDPAKAAEREQRRRDAAARRAQREADRKRREQERQQAKLDRAVAADAKRREQLAQREQRLTERQQRAAERAARRTQREAERKLRQQQPKGGGGGKGGSTKPKPDKAAAAGGNRATVGRALGVDTDALAALADGTQPTGDAAATMERAGLISKQRDGSYATTAAGRAFLNAAEAGNERQARAMLARAQDQQAARDERRARTEARAGTTPSGRRAKTGASLTVFKDAAGRFRWLAVSSTAFQDRDGEIVSVKALEDDVARSDATGQYGPLLWWHMPDVVIGDCDFRAVHGRSLIESGTFRDERYATAIKADDELSLGFRHPAVEPDAHNIFHTIDTFERSVVPYPEGRGSNLFTRLMVKEVPMLTEAKKATLAGRLGPNGPDILAEMLAGAEQTEKAADAAGVRYKASDTPPPGTQAVWDGEAWVAAEKAPPPAEEMAMAEDEATADADLADADAEIDAEEPGGYFSAEELAEISAAVAPAVAEAVLAALMPALDMEAKMAKWADEVKGAMGGFATQQAQKDAAAAELATAMKASQDQVADLAARLKNLEGDQPRAAGFRASIATETEVGDAHRLKAAKPTNEPNYLDFWGLGA